MTLKRTLSSFYLVSLYPPFPLSFQPDASVDILNEDHDWSSLA
jgi:hypothetical protein